jgi:hypothetical protein
VKWIWNISFNAFCTFRFRNSHRWWKSMHDVTWFSLSETTYLPGWRSTNTCRESLLKNIFATNPWLKETNRVGRLLQQFIKTRENKK